VKSIVSRLLAFAAIGLAGCGFSVPDVASVPDHPTFETDVLPVMNDHCNLCHSGNPNRGAPRSFRLDVYEDVGGTRGDGVGPNGTAIVEKWVADGAPR
jgi:hypothetical protein